MSRRFSFGFYTLLLLTVFTNLWGPSVGLVVATPDFQDDFVVSQQSFPGHTSHYVQLTLMENTEEETAFESHFLSSGYVQEELPLFFDGIYHEERAKSAQIESLPIFLQFQNLRL